MVYCTVSFGFFSSTYSFVFVLSLSLGQFCTLHTKLSPVGLAAPSLSGEEVLGHHVEDDAVALALLGLVVALLLGLASNLLHLHRHLWTQDYNQAWELSKEKNL